MKNIVVTLFLVSSSAFASDCEKLLLEKVTKNPNIKVVKIINNYSCGKNACAVTFEHDSSPYPNLKVLSFLDLKSKMQVLWASEVGPYFNGKELLEKKRFTYINVVPGLNDSLNVAASIETQRDAIFWPPHKVYHQETLNCSK
jgi:hypothetical protein